MGATAAAETFTDGAFTYTTTGTSTVTLSKSASKETAITVPSIVTYNGSDYTVTAIGENAFKWSKAVSISLPSTIEAFEYGAFNGSDKLTTINMPAALKVIGEYSLSSTAITSIDIPASVEEIGNSAFFTCKSLTSITFHEGLKTIGNSVFYKCPITEAILPESVTSLGKSAFMSCDKLASVKLPSTLTSLGDGCFYKCASLTSITIPEGVTSIGTECFLESGITEVTLPASVETIGSSAFAHTQLTAINLAAGNKNFKLIGGVLYDTAERLLYAVPMKGLTQVRVSDKCIGINGGAFWGSEVSEVVLPEGILAIDDFAFCQSALAKINFPSSLTYIGEQGFAATQLTEIILPENMPYVLDGAFAGCQKATSITIPSAATLIYNHAFHNDVNVASVTCQGTTPPVIDDVYETYDSPFYGISTTTPLYVPKGTADAYKEAGWGEYFKITEGDYSVLALTSASPASGTVLGKYADMKVELTFASDVVVSNATPEVYLRKNSEISGATIDPDDCWKATQLYPKTVNIWASDYDGLTQYFTPEQETEYYLVIPAGVVKDAATGAANERIVIKWTGPAAPKPLEVVSTSPADGEVITSAYADMKFVVTFADDITILDYAPGAELREDNPETGKLIEPDLGWKAAKDGSNAVNIWGADYDSYLQSFKVEADKSYYMIIPAGIAQNANGDKNDKIVITIKGPTSGIEGVETESCHAVAHFDHLGRAIAPEAKGIHIVKMSDGSVKKVLVK